MVTFFTNKKYITLIMTLLLDYIAKDYIGLNQYVMLNAILRSYYKKKTKTKNLTTPLNEGYGINNNS